ncbi:hypothetical protein AO262_02780 [Pseudomonas fluorescens ABAC62]|nr:hypothetical protein AO262_02780 [Pseudomonas fluorescens ABAC62]
MTSEPFASTGEAFTTAFRLSPPLPELEYSALGNRLRQGLLDSLNSTLAPSVVINELYLAHSRCAGHALKLLRVWRQAPRISRVIRQTLRETFQVEPDGLLVNVSPSSGAGKHGNGLTETFMKLLAERECVKRGLLSDQACASGCLADEVLNKALDVDLLERIKAAASAYWQVLAEEAVCTRQAHWCDLYKQFVTDRAVLAHGFGQLSDEGLAMLLALVETPTPESRKQAAGRWARLHVSEVVCLGQNQAAIPIRGALHVHHGALPTAQRHVVFLPATSQMFYEFDTLEQWQTRFPALVNARARALWAMLPLERRHELPDATSHTLLPFTAEHPGPLITADPLEQSATSLLQVQWDNELATLLETNIAFLFPGNAIKGDYMSPTERLLHVEQWRQVLRVPRKWRRTFSGLLEWDKRRRHLEISFASLSKQLPLQQRELKVRLQTRAILSLSESENLSQESPATALHCLMGRRIVWMTRSSGRKPTAPAKRSKPGSWLRVVQHCRTKRRCSFSSNTSTKKCCSALRQSSITHRRQTAAATRSFSE